MCSIEPFHFQASTIVKDLHSIEMLSLQKLVFVSKGTTVECFAVQMVSDGNLLVIFTLFVTEAFYRTNTCQVLVLLKASVTKPVDPNQSAPVVHVAV